MMDKTKGTSKIIFEQKENYWADYGEYSSDSYHDLYCLDDKLIYIYSSHFVVLRRDGEILYEFDLEFDRFKNTKLNSHYLVGYTMRGKIFSIDLNSYQMDEKITKGAMEQGDLCNEYLVASFSYDKIKAWDYDGNELWTYPKNQSVDLIKLSPSGKYVMFLFSRELRILNKEQQLLSTVKSAVGYSEYSPKITFTPNEKYFFVERSNFTIDLYNIQGDKIYTFIGSNLTIPKNSDHFFYIGKDSGYYSVKRFLLPSKINQWYLNGGFNDYMNQRIYE